MAGAGGSASSSAAVGPMVPFIALTPKNEELFGSTCECFVMRLNPAVCSFINSSVKAHGTASV